MTSNRFPVWMLVAATWAATPGCEESTDGDFDPQFEISDVVPTVATVRWSVDAETIEDAYVDFGRGGEWEYRAPASCEDGSCEAVLLGMKPATDYAFQAVMIANGQAEGSLTGDLTTGHLTTGIPDVNVEFPLPELSSGGFVLTTFIPGPATILDADLDVVWWYEPDVDHMHYLNRLVLARDGGSFRFLMGTNRNNGGVDTTKRKLFQVSLDGTSASMDERGMIHHEMIELADGSIAVLMYDPREIDGEEVAGDRLVEIRPDGSEVDLWSIWDHVEFDPELEFEGGERWGHCNAIDYDEDEEVYYLSSRNFSTIYAIDRPTGDVLWRVGRTDGDFDLAEGSWFENQHQFQRLDHGLLVFNNGVQGGTETSAWELSLDTGAWEAEHLWSFQPDPPLGVYAFGDVIRLDGGNTLIAWGASGRLDEVTPDGEVVRRADLDLAAGIGYITWMESLY